MDTSKIYTKCDIFDMSEYFQPGALPCCPVCDNEIQDWDEYCVITAHGSAALAHRWCIEDINCGE